MPSLLSGPTSSRGSYRRRAVKIWLVRGCTPSRFGDFSQGGAVVDNKQMTVLRDPFSAKPFALFYAHSLVDGGVLDFDAIKIRRLGGNTQSRGGDFCTWRRGFGMLAYQASEI